MDTGQSRNTDVEDGEEQDKDDKKAGNERGGQNLDSVKQGPVDDRAVVGRVAWLGERGGGLKRALLSPGSGRSVGAGDDKDIW